MKELPNKKSKIIIDACIFMLGVEYRNFCDIKKRKRIFLDACVEYFDDIYMHKVVYDEIKTDLDTKKYIDDLINQGIITIVHDPKFDPVFSAYLDKLASFDLLKAKNPRKNQGEIHSLAYAALNNIPYFSTNDRDARIACEEIDICFSITVIGLEDLLVIAEKINLAEDLVEIRKARKSIYKKYCKR